MKKMSEHIQSADWKSEKHVPVIECPDTVQKGKIFEVTVGLGKEVEHPNTTEHHIRWVSLYFYPEGEKFPFQVGHFEFNAHGESTRGANQGPVYTHHQVTVALKTDQSGVFHALSFCNIHGVWENSRELSLA